MISQYKICMGDRIKKLCFVLLKFHLNLLRFFELGFWHIAAIFWEQFSIHYANLRFWSSSLLLHSLYLEAYASFILNPPDSSSELSNIVVLFWFFFFTFFWQVVRFRDSVVHKICRFIGEHEFITQCSLTKSGRERWRRGSSYGHLLFTRKSFGNLSISKSIHNTTVTDGHTNVNSRTFLTVMK